MAFTACPTNTSQAGCRDVAPEIASGRVIVAHLGSGASMCALAGGRSIESTMGFTALDGLPMGTRPGQLDPGVVLYLIGEKGMSAAAVQDLCYRECGLKALSGISNDVRELEASADPKAEFALDYFCLSGRTLHRACWRRRSAASTPLSSRLASARIRRTCRARIAAELAWLGAVLDPAANAADAPIDIPPDSRLAVYVIPTDEELMIARHTLALLSSSATASRILEKAQ